MPTTISISPTTKALIEKWQNALQHLRETIEPITSDADLAKLNLNHITGLDDFSKDPKRYSYYASRIMDYFIFYVPDSIVNALDAGKYTDSVFSGGRLKALLKVKAITSDYIQPAAFYMDFDACVPHILTPELYEKMQWTEWVLIKIRKNTTESNLDYVTKSKILQFIDIRLPSTTERINTYAKDHNLPRLSPEQLEQKHEQDKLAKREAKAVITEESNLTLPSVAETYQITTKNRLKMLLKKHAALLTELQSPTLKYQIPLGYTKPDEIITFSRVQLKIKSLEKEIDKTKQELFKIAETPRHNTIATETEEIELNVISPTLKNPLIDHFIRDLENYKTRRETELNAQRTQYHYFWSRITGYPAHVKISSADKMIQILKGKIEQLTNDELGALRDCRLGEIIKKYQNKSLLPKAFVEGERMKLLRTVFK